MSDVLPAAGGRPRFGVIGYAPGAFDLFHVGHLNLLHHAAERCDHLVVGVVSDDVLRRRKGISPVVPEAERAAIVAALACVDSVFIERHTDRLVTWDAVRFDVFFKGDDWRGTRRALTLQRRLHTVGARVEYFPYTATTSSTQLRASLKNIESMAMLAQRESARIPA